MIYIYIYIYIYQTANCHGEVIIEIDTVVNKTAATVTATDQPSNPG